MINVGSLSRFLGPSQAPGVGSVQCGLISVTWGRQLTSHDLRSVHSVEYDGQQLTSGALWARLYTLAIPPFREMGFLSPSYVGRRRVQLTQARPVRVTLKLESENQPQQAWQRPWFLSSFHDRASDGERPRVIPPTFYLPVSFWFYLPSPATSISCSL